MTTLGIALSGNLSNIIWSSHNRRHDKGPLRLHLARIKSLFTTDDGDEAEHE